MQLSRRSFFGLFPLSACAVSVAASLKPSQSAPVLNDERWAQGGDKLFYTPFGEHDWIAFPRQIKRISAAGPDHLLVECYGADYVLSHAGTPERDWFVRQVPT